MSSGAKKTEYISSPGCCLTPRRNFQRLHTMPSPNATGTSVFTIRLSPRVGRPKTARLRIARLLARSICAAGWSLELTAGARSRDASHRSWGTAPNVRYTCLLYTSDAADEEDGVDLS